MVARMRKAAGIILIVLGVFFIYILIDVVVVFGIDFFLAPFVPIFPQGFLLGVFLIVFVVSAAFHITGGILCLRRKHWRVCLAAASFAVLFSVFDPGGSLLSGNVRILPGWISWVMLVATVIAVIFILRAKKEWQEISGSVDGEVSNGG